MGQAKDKANYEAWMKDDKRIYFQDPSDPEGVIHVHDKFRNMEAIVVLMMRAAVRSGIDLPLLLEGKTLDAEQRQQVAPGHYEAVAKNIIASIDNWRAESAKVAA